MIKLKSIRKSAFLPLVISVAFFVSGFLTSYFHEQLNKPEIVNRRVQEEILRAEKKLNHHFLSLEKQFSSPSRENFQYLREASDEDVFEEGMIFVVYRHDSLVSWSSNIFQADPFLNPSVCKDTLLLKGNGYYFSKTRRYGVYTFMGLQLIKSQYNFSNEYLPSGYNPKLKIPQGTELSVKPGTFNLFNKEGKFLFSLSFDNLVQDGRLFIFLVFILYFTSFLIFISFIFRIYVKFYGIIHNRLLLAFLFLIDIIILRALQAYFRFPSSLYETELFSSVYFAVSDYLPSLGDLLINLLILVQLSYYFNKLVPSRILSKQATWKKILLIITAYIVLLILFELLQQGFSLFIFNSNIPLSFGNTLALTPFSLAGLVAIVSAFTAFLILLNMLSRIIWGANQKRKANWIIPLILFCCYVLYKYLFETIDFFYLTILFILILFTLFPYKSATNKLPHSAWMMGLIFILSISGTYSINKLLQEREHEHRKILASHLSDSRDKLLEYFYGQIAENIRNDMELRSRLNQGNATSQSESEIIDYIQKKYFQQFRLKYNILLTLCHEGKKLNIKPDNRIADCYTYFNTLITNTLQPVDSSGLYFMNQSADITYYLGRIPLGNGNKYFAGANTLFVEMDARTSSRGLGYPELLMDKSGPGTENLSGYSFAYYYRDDLVRNVGKFSYEIENQNYRTSSAQHSFLNLQGYSHLVHPIDRETILVISLEREGISELIAPFSFLILFLFAIWMTIRILDGNSKGLNLRNASFRFRLQVFMVSLILISSILIGGITIFYLKQLNYNKNKDIVSEKMNTILVELENRYGNSAGLPYLVIEELQGSLLSLSNANFTDINIYDLNGMLLSSSRKEIVQEGLVSGLMNPLSLLMMNERVMSFYIHEESIGKYKFLSAYAPLRNLENQRIGYINLPYFARQEDMRIEMARLVAAYVNVYIIMIALAVLLALAVSRFVTRPLQLIRFQLGNVRFGFKNAKVEWSRSDEIGDLVTQYNHMIDELATSAELLARSERESAWREMARQVAHEIKNPLTPIKLSMQHLIKSWEDKAPDWDQRLKKFSQTLILQIDTLSAIATEFSDFAQMPKSEFRMINLEEVIAASAQLFRNVDNVTIHCPHITGHHEVYADENQMLRVFNNLVKNSIQAMTQDMQGTIDIQIEKQESTILVVFKDNGSGIPVEQQARIFSPNFTTKSAGMGLGLAMVKNIIDNSGGKIWFESSPGEGTTFYIQLPARPR